jgi:hypothetical protein
MGESNTMGVDPRFDPRFQRGYTGVEADAVTSSSYPPRLGLGAEVPPATDDAAARLLEAMKRTMPPRPAPPPTAAATPSGGDDAMSTVGDVDVLVPEPQSEPEEGNRPERPWFIAGWVFSAALLALGSWWVWAVNSNPAYYTGVATADMAFHQLGWSVSPTLMQAGAIGLVLTTSFAAARQLQRAARSRRTAATATATDAGTDPTAPGSAFWRTPGVIGLIVIVVVAVVVVIWLVGRAIDGSSFGYGPAPSGDEVTRMALAQVAFAAIGPLAFAALGSVLGIILLGAREARRAGDLSEPPER